MGLILFVLFIVVPFAELAVLIKVGSVIGVVPTLAILILVSVLGATLVKREGVGVWTRFRSRIEAGQVPGKELVDGALILFAGALLLTPGFLTDVLGLLLLLPPFRALIRGASAGWLTKRATLGQIGRRR